MQNHDLVNQFQQNNYSAGTNFVLIANGSKEFINFILFDIFLLQREAYLTEISSV